MKVPGEKGQVANTLLTDATLVHADWYKPIPSPSAPYQPKWERWLYVPRIELGKAIALTLDIDPACLSSGKHLIPDDFKTRLAVAIEHLQPGGVLSDFAGEARHDSIVVTLQEVARLAQLCRWTLPPEFPRHIEQGAEAPPPATQPLDAAPEPQLFSADADQGEQEDRAQESSTGTWHDRVREVADELHRKDINAGAWSSNKDIAERVASEAIKRGIRGPTGQLTAGNILREALQGGRWKRPAN